MTNYNFSVQCLCEWKDGGHEDHCHRTLLKEKSRWLEIVDNFSLIPSRLPANNQSASYYTPQRTPCLPASNVNGVLFRCPSATRSAARIMSHSD